MKGAFEELKTLVAKGQIYERHEARGELNKLFKSLHTKGEDALRPGRRAARPIIIFSKPKRSK